MPKIVLHQLEISPFCDKVRRTLAYKRLPYEVRNVPMAKLSSLRKLAPTGKAPVVEIDGRVVHDSSDICRALDALAPDPPLTPADPRERALADIIEDWADESLYFFEMTMRFTWPYDRARWVTKILEHDNAVMRVLGRPLVPYLTRQQGMAQGLARRSEADILAELGRHLAAIDSLLDDGRFLVGSRLSLADIAVASQLACVAGSRQGSAAIGGFPRIAAWMERIDRATAPSPAG
jgi:glutathione S-transferase